MNYPDTKLYQGRYPEYNGDAMPLRTCDEGSQSPIDRDATLIVLCMIAALALMLTGIFVMGSFSTLPFFNGLARGIGTLLFFAGLAAGFGAGILLIKLAYDTWKVETNAELRARYGRSIKWGILITFLFPVIPFLWVLLLYGYFFSKARHEAEQLAAGSSRRRSAVRGRRGPAFAKRSGRSIRVH